MLYNKKENIAIALLLAVSLAIHFAWFGHPNMTVFDEVHFGKFLSAYFTHQYYFDIHPPLGKLILAGWGWLWGFKPGFSFSNIGDVFPDKTYIALRFLPSLAGAFLSLVVYGIARRLKMSRVAALLAGFLVALDNALVVQSRLILLDSFLLLFGFGAIWCYLYGRNKHMRHCWLLAAGILGGMAACIKWTGGTFLAIIVLLELLHIWHERHNRVLYKIWPAIAALIAAPLILYYSVFALHFALLGQSGPGDAFMSLRFQHDLVGNPNAADNSLDSLTLPEKFVELNLQMFESNQRLTATHPYSSLWYTWPFMQRPIFYWVSGTERIYLLGNPLVWWGSTVAVFILAANLLLSSWRRPDKMGILLMFAWLLNLLPFIGITRVMFLYHYFTALIWAILILAYIVDQTKRPTRNAIVIISLALVAFVFFAPLTYGLSLTDRAYDMRAWFSSWR